MKILKNILLIINESYKWRNRELLISKGGNQLKKLTFWGLIRNNLLLFITFSTLIYFCPNIINTDLAGYLINALSIFIGLFTTVLILFFDKYLIHRTNIESNNKNNETIHLEKIRVKNFSTRFVFITLETILIAIVLIALLSSPLVLGDFFKEDLSLYFFKVGLKQIIIFLGLGLISLIKLLTLVLFYKLGIRLLFVFGSLGEYMLSIFNNKIKNI